MSVNWKDSGVPFLDFTEEITQEWINRGFNKDACKEWLNIGFLAQDYGLAEWLRDIIKQTPDEVLNNSVPLIDLRKQYNDYLNKEENSEESEDEDNNPPPKQTPAEVLITQILTVLDVWKANVLGEEKESVKQVIKQLADNKGSQKEQYQAVRNLLSKYTYYNSWRLEDYLKKWGKLLGVDKKKKEEETIIPDWLFPEEEEKEDKPKPPPKPSIKHKEPRKPWECKICEKRTFFSKAEFIQAHGTPKLEPSIWVYKTIQPNKKEPYFISLWVCKVCKQEYHTPKCKYYKEIKPIIPKPEIFDWETYWKWWFGVYTLDWQEKRFFGKYKENKEEDDWISDDGSDGYETAPED